MRALRMHRLGQVTLDEVSMPEPGPNEIVVAPAFVGVCATDLHVLYETVWQPPLPLTLGHEFGGQVMAIGEQVEGISVGDRVAVEPLLPCRHCVYCRQGMTNLCLAMGHLGIWQHGALADAVLVPALQATRAPDGVGDLALAMTEPLACALNFVDKAEIRAGETVLVAGGGPIGLMTTHLLASMGARVLVSEPEDQRRQLAKLLGAKEALDPGQTVVPQFVRDFTGGLGADVAIECVGISATVRDALSSVRRGGRVVFAGNAVDEVTLDMRDIVNGELIVRGANATRFQVERALRLIESAVVDPTKMITGIFPLEAAPDVLALAQDDKSEGKLMIAVHGRAND